MPQRDNKPIFQMQTNPQISRFHSCFKIKLASQRLYPCLIRRRLRWDCGRKCGKESRFGPAGVNEGEREEMNACKPSNSPEGERSRENAVSPLQNEHG